MLSRWRGAGCAPAGDARRTHRRKARSAFRVGVWGQPAPSGSARAEPSHPGPSTALAVAAGVVLALTALSAPAMASGIGLPAVGTSGSNEAHADAAAVYFNPAQLGWLARGEVLVNVGAAVGRAAYTRERLAAYQYADSFDFALPVSPDDIDPALTGEAAQVVANPASATGDVFAAVPIGVSPVTFGVGVYAPYAAILSLPEDGAQRFQVQDATILALYVTPAVGWRVSERLSLGANVSYVLGFAELARVQDFAVLPDVGDALRGEPIEQANDFGPDAPPAVRELDVMARPTRLRRMFSHGATASAGLSLRASERVALSLAYRHGVAMRFEGTAEIDMNDPFFTQDLASQGLQFDPLVEGDGTLRFRLPSTLAGGVSLNLSPRLALDLLVSWVRWSSVETFELEVRSPQLAQPDVGLGPSSEFALRRDWRDAAELEATLRWQASRRLGTWWVLGWQSAATPDETLDMASIDGQRVVLGAGAEFAVSERWALGADATLHQMIRRQVVTSEYDVGNGEYDLRLMMVGAHVAMRW